MSKRDTQHYRVGLTGGIASGKSTVADLFAELGAAIIDTDIIARDVVQPGQPALDEIRKRFGDTVVDKDGALDRVQMRHLIFADEASRKDLEAILHPRIGNEVRRQSSNTDAPYQMIVVPLLVGSPLLRFVHRVLVVDCEEKTQIRRLLARDSETEAQARRILATQASREERLSIADDVIRNDGSRRDLRLSVKALDADYRRRAAAQDRA